MKGREVKTVELKGPIGLSNDCFEPDPTYDLNFMLDTSAINKLAENPEDLKLVTLAKKQLGYIYFRNLIQDREIVGMKSDGSFHKMDLNGQKKSQFMGEIINTLPIIRVPYMATLMHNAFILDGTCYEFEDEGKTNEVFCKVFNENPDNFEDAVIIESAIQYNCITISNDRDMCVNTNSVFPGKAMWYKKFIEGIKEKL
ncbi:hypothetical protein D7X98_06585 [bacterium 1XD8-76]|nr:hypothetical protein D7X98_06585 [bacterium 1XD8-76]